MGKRMASMLLTAGAVALAVGLSAAPSSAATATTWSVSPGGTVTMVKSGVFTLQDLTTGTKLVCARTKGTGHFESGSGLSGAHIGTVTALSLTDCTGPHGLTFKMRAGHLPWTLNADTYNPAITAGLTTGTITGIHALLFGTKCHATVDGTSLTADNGQTQIHYHNSLAKLKIRTQRSNLHFYNAGCGGLIKSHDAITFSVAYNVSPAQTITGS